MVVVLQRVTTQFIQEEDRIRIAGARSDGGRVVVWLTRRLLVLMLPILLKQLDQQFASATLGHRDALQEFAQQAARDALPASEPVEAAYDDESILATFVDVGTAQESIYVTFRNQAEGGFCLPLTAESLRQWLHILYQADRKGDWQLPNWPAWLAGSGSEGQDSALPMH